MKQIVILVCFLLMASLAHAVFELYLKDGSSIRVSRITFKGKNVEVFPVGGVKKMVAADDIDYETTGIKRPEAAVGVTIYGTSKATKSADTFRTEGVQKTSQEELEEAWNKATRTAVALQDYGIIRKGDTVRIISNDVSLYRIIARSEGELAISMVDATTFFETFSSKNEREKYFDQYGPYKVKDVPVATTSKPFVELKQKEEPPPPEPSLVEWLIKSPLALGVGGLIILLLVLNLAKGKR